MNDSGNVSLLLRGSLDMQGFHNNKQEWSRLYFHSVSPQWSSILSVGMLAWFTQKLRSSHHLTSSKPLKKATNIKIPIDKFTSRLTTSTRSCISGRFRVIQLLPEAMLTSTGPWALCHWLRDMSLLRSSLPGIFLLPCYRNLCFTTKF